MKKFIPLILACFMCFVSCSTTQKATSTKTSSATLTPEETAVCQAFQNKQGKLAWPVAKGTKVSDYGTQPHREIPSVSFENHGIDILTKPGTTVRAIFKGKVTTIIEIMGKNVVMIRHGCYVSVYQNLTDICVKKGDMVSTKQPIGKISNDYTTDEFLLHFELWEDSEHVNPNLWLSRKNR
ncbi:MAG: M23 family metallopeptidase [Bacteroidales bacterium]|nr:M23 family metallopeptidase [Bacteroidales bacterium]